MNNQFIEFVCNHGLGSSFEIRMRSITPGQAGTKLPPATVPFRRTDWGLPERFELFVSLIVFRPMASCLFDRRAFSSAPDVLSSGRRPSTRSSGLEALAMHSCRPTWVLLCLASGREFCKFEVPSEAPASFLCFMVSCLFSVAPDRVKCMVVGKDSTGILIHSFSQISLKWLVRFEPEVYVNVVVMQALGLDLPLEVCRDHRCLSTPAGIHYSRRWEGPEWPISGHGEGVPEFLQSA